MLKSGKRRDVMVKGGKRRDVMVKGGKRSVWKPNIATRSKENVIEEKGRLKLRGVRLSVESWNKEK
jgi:hypothetical protein